MVEKFLARPVLFIVGLFVALAIIGLAVRSCSEARQGAAVARVEREEGKAAGASAADAVTTLQEAVAAEKSIDDATKENDRAIKSADGASAPVSDGVDDAGRRSLCGRAAYRGSRDCLLYVTPK
jgi:hypothetical protein